MNRQLNCKYLVLILFAIIFIFLTIFLSNNYISVIKEEIINEELSQSHSRYEGVDIITRIEDSKLFYKSIHYPKFSKNELNREILDFVTEEEKIFDKAVKEQEKNKSSNFQYYFYINFDIIHDIDNVYTFILKESTYLGGAHPDDMVRIFIIDMKEEKLVKSPSIILDTQDNRDKLFELLHIAFEESEYQDFFFEDSLKEWVYSKKQTFDNIYFTNEYLIFVFDKYQVTAGAAGIPEIRLPIKDLTFLMTEEWINKFDTMNDNSTQPIESDDENETEQIIEEEKKEDKIISDKVVAITFDDGPHPENTLEILSLLEQYDAKATFFMLGARVDFYPEIAKEIYNQGHELGNHTWNHKNLTKLSKSELEEEVQKTNEVIKDATDSYPSVLRPPYGAVNNEIRNAIDLPVVLWTVDTLDWKSRDPQAVLESVKSDVKNRSVILFHDIYPETVEAIELALEYLKSEGYQFITVSELLDLSHR